MRDDRTAFVGLLLLAASEAVSWQGDQHHHEHIAHGGKGGDANVDGGGVWIGGALIVSSLIYSLIIGYVAWHAINRFAPVTSSTPQPQPSPSPEPSPTIENSPNFYCAITGRMILEPVCARDGVYYEKKALEDWLGKNDGRTPTRELIRGKLKTGEARNDPLTIDEDFKASIDAYASQLERQGQTVQRGFDASVSNASSYCRRVIQRFQRVFDQGAGVTNASLLAADATLGSSGVVLASAPAFASGAVVSTLGAGGALVDSGVDASLTGLSAIGLFNSSQSASRADRNLPSQLEADSRSASLDAS